MTEIFALVSTTVSIAIQVKTVVEQIQYNREKHRLLVNRILNSLTQLKAQSRKITKSSPGLILVVGKLKSELERILAKCKDTKSRKNGIGVKLKEWFFKDSIAAALHEVETQISYSFQEFGALGTIRIERKLGDHNVQVNRKLDELLRRTPAVRGGIDPSPIMNRNLSKTPIAIPLQARTTSDSSTNSSVNASDVPSVVGKSFSSKERLTPSLPSSVYSGSGMKTSPIERSVQAKNYSSGLVSEKPSSRKYMHSRSMGFLFSVKSESSISSTIQSTRSADSFYEYQANKLDSECKRLRSLKHLSEALVPGRRAVVLRRMIYAADQSVATTAALARSLTYLARCLKDIHVDSHLTGTKVSAELTAVLSESVELYKVAFKEDKACRIDLATALYNLSVRQSELPKNNLSSTSSLYTHVVLKKLQKSRNLNSALAAAEEAVHHFTILEREDSYAFGMDLANALLNLSFIHSDIENNEDALTSARKAVMLAYRFTSTDPQTQERARTIRTLHKALMRVSFCLDYLGRSSEAQEAEIEANDVLKKPFFTIGS